MELPKKIPNSGALFVFGGSKFSGSLTSCLWLKADVVISVSCGDEHTALVTEKGKVYLFGSNNWGQLGLGHTQAVEKPTCVRSLSNEFITLVACGRNHTLVATKDDRLFGFGNNSDSQLAVSSKAITNFESPKEISSLPPGKIKKIAAGGDFCVLLQESGDVYTWGNNSDGQLGLSDVTEISEPTRLLLTEKITDIACGYYHTAMVTSSHKLYTCGEDEFGKLGVRTSAASSLLPSEVKLPLSVNVEHVTCGGSHTAFITTDKKLFTFGGGFHGELGHGEDILQSEEPKLVEYFAEKAVSQVYCGENFSCCVTENGLLYSFGDGRNGKLGVIGEDFSNQFFPILCEQLQQYSIKFAECGGCHMVVFVVSREVQASDSVDTQSVGDFSTMAQSEDLDLSQSRDEVGEDTLNLSLRSSLAREKRRKARDAISSHTLPALSTLKPEELMEAVKTFPKSAISQHDSSTAFATNSKFQPKESDEASDISTLNRVHQLVLANGETSFVPVTHSHSFDKHSDNIDDDDDDLSEDLPVRNSENGTNIPNGESEDEVSEDIPISESKKLINAPPSSEIAADKKPDKLVQGESAATASEDHGREQKSDDVSDDQKIPEPTVDNNKAKSSGENNELQAENDKKGIDEKTDGNTDATKNTKNTKKSKFCTLL